MGVMTGINIVSSSGTKVGTPISTTVPMGVTYVVTHCCCFESHDKLLRRNGGYGRKRWQNLMPMGLQVGSMDGGLFSLSKNDKVDRALV